jgi:hypothetical protein
LTNCYSKDPPPGLTTLRKEFTRRAPYAIKGA